ncbi:MAG: cytochrome P460 family protein [Gammaproteobacteria bacterium]|nr:cytochrome P460 family protein [Gammaproteobacteria bacterium]
MAAFYLARNPASLARAAAHLAPDRSNDEAGAQRAAAGSTAAGLHAARFSDSGRLLRPQDPDRWVFMGASVGLGYNAGEFDPERPGMFQVVSMEPSAYAYFQEHGAYADGTMFLLSFYATQRNEGEESGLTQGDLDSFEIHLIDKGLFEDGRAFYPFAKDDSEAPALPPGNPCVQCHLRQGVFDGTFVQFYPVMRKQIPEHLRRKSG